MLTQREQRKEAKEFAEKWEAIGYEKGDSARFWLSLLNEVYGVDHPAEFIRFEDQVMLDNTSFIDGYIPSTHVLIEQKSIDKDLRKGIRQSDGSLLSPFQQAKRYSIELPYDDRPRWIVLCNFKEFHIFDMNKPQSEPEVVYLKDLEEDYYRLNFLVDEEDHNVKRTTEVSIQAGELVGVLYDALLKQYQNPEDEETLKDLNILCVRLVFCFYAEDAGLFGHHNMFHDYLANYKDNPASFRDVLIKLFRVLDQEEHERDPYQSDELLAFPYVNGGLFEKDDVVIPRINEKIIDIILNQTTASFDWSKISPTIFGGVFESTLNPETRRSGGMHYTSIENIHKVIDPLFMDQLREEFKEISNLKTLSIKKRRFEELQDKMASLKFLDPAAGSGNFLTETYISLRKLENKILKELHGNQIMLGAVHNPIRVSISQFYGIEINDFAVSVARTALWIAESQMMKETEDIVNMNLDFLPLKSYPNIVEGNALMMDWEEVISKNDLDYIMGNPPFVGHQWRTKSQVEDMDLVFSDYGKHGKLDYVCAWYAKSSNFMKGTKIRAAFVSTNSICQGESVPILWEYLFNEKEVEIQFAYETFVWNSEAINSAAVHCVIVGFTVYRSEEKKLLYSNRGRSQKVDKINGYLVPAENIFIRGRGSILNKKFPKMTKGSQPTDGGGLVLDESEYREFVKRHLSDIDLIRPYMGSFELINNKARYCLWLKDVDPHRYSGNKYILSRLEAVVESRLKSKTLSVREFAKYPYLFTQIRQPMKDYLAVPAMSSSNRKYIPIGFLDQNIIASNQLYIIESDSLELFAILTSNVHMGWMKTICGRLKSDYRYAPFIYNNFPFPNLNNELKQKLVETGTGILEARNKFLNSSLADLYNELTMPPELRKAHQENDKAVMEAYGFAWRNMTESECVAELMKLYQKLSK